MGSQCYGFITLTSRQEATKLLDIIRDCGPVTVGSATLRVDWAQGSLPDWKKQGPAVYRSRGNGHGLQVGCAVWAVVGDALYVAALLC